MRYTRSLILLCLWLWAGIQVAGAQTAQARRAVTSGPVYSVAKLGDTTYWGGQFSSAGLYTPYLTSITTQDDVPDFPFPYANGRVYAIVADGQGGWYMGGNFSQVSGITMPYLVHIMPDSSVDLNFFPEPNAQVNALALINGQLYVGGNFTLVAGQPIAHLTRLDLPSGSPDLNWVPAPDLPVEDIKPSNSNYIHVGGSFDRIAGINQEAYAKIRLDSAIAIPTISFNSVVYDIEPLSRTTLVGGAMTGGGHFARHMAALNPDDDFPDPAFPVFNGRVEVIVNEPNGNGWYVGGRFSQVDGQRYPYLVHILPDFSVNPAFVPNPSAPVYAILPYFGDLIVGGRFSSIGGQGIANLARIDPAAGGTARNWNPEVNGDVYAIDRSVGFVNQIYVGGTFTEVAGIRQRNFARFDLNTGEMIPTISVNTTVWSIVRSATTGYTYLGGNFTQGGYYAPGCAQITDPDSVPNVNFPTFLGQANAVISDGSGGWYIGGQFSRVNTTTQRYLIHVLSNGSVDPNFNPDPNNFVNCLILDNNRLYVGGRFTQIGGQGNDYIAALNPTTGAVDAGWVNSADPNGAVMAMSLTPQGLYIGGGFTTVGGQTRQRLALLSPANGSLNSATVSFNGAVNVLAYRSGSGRLYVGGSFSQVNSNPRGYCIRINPSNHLVDTGFDPQVQGSVNALEFATNGNLRIGGSFTMVGGQSQAYLAEVNANSGALETSFSPSLNGPVQTIYGGFVGGFFTQINGQDRPYAANILQNGSLGSWNPEFNGAVSVLFNGSNGVIAGGNFSYTAYRKRNFLGAFFYLDNKFTDAWTVDANGPVYHLELAGPNYFYAGGAFTSISGQPRSHLAEVGIQNPGGVSLWNPTLNQDVRDITHRNDTVYIAGFFTQVEDSTRPYFAALTNTNHQTVELLDWDPQAQGAGYSVQWTGNDILVGGDFNYLKFRDYNYAVALEPQAEIYQEWNIDPNNQVRSLAVDTLNRKLYVGGNYQRIAGQPRSGLVRFDVDSIPAPTIDVGWDAGLPTTGYSGFINDLRVYEDRLYIGGLFDDLVQGESRAYVMALDTISGNLSSWYPRVDREVNTIAIHNGQVLLGGSFLYAKYVPARNLVAIDEQTGLAIPGLMPETNNNVRSIHVLGEDLFIGGQFTIMDGINKGYLARFTPRTGQLDSWNPRLNQAVYALGDDGSQLYVGGQFTQVVNQNRNHLAAFDLSNLTLNPWNPDANRLVTVIEVAGPQEIYVGGDFTQIGGQTQNYLAMVDNQGQHTPWTNSPNRAVNDIDLTADRIYVGGDFSQVDGQTQNGVVAYTRSNRAVEAWNTGLIGSVEAVSARDTVVMIGGNFTNIGQQSTTYGAVVRADNAAFTGDFLVNQPIRSFWDAGNVIYTGGSFTEWDEQPWVRYAAAFDGTNLGIGGMTAVAFPSDQTWSVFPNPTTGEIYVSGLMGPLRLKVIDLQGKVVRAGEYVAPMQISLNGLIPGLYVLEMVQGQRVIRAKVMLR